MSGGLLVIDSTKKRSMNRDSVVIRTNTATQPTRSNIAFVVLRVRVVHFPAYPARFA